MKRRRMKMGKWGEAAGGIRPARQATSLEFDPHSTKGDFAQAKETLKMERGYCIKGRTMTKRATG